MTQAFHRPPAASTALITLQEICDIGYSPHDIITTFFRVVKLSPELPEFLKLEFIRVRRLSPQILSALGGHSKISLLSN